MPLKIQSSSLSLAEQDALNKMILSPAFKTLKKVVEGMALEKEIECVNNIGEAAQFEKYDEAALKSKKLAAPYRHAVIVLAEIESTAQHTEITQVTQTPV